MRLSLAVMLCALASIAGATEELVLGTQPEATETLLPVAVVAGADAVSIPRILSYQGKLTDTLGVPVPDTTRSVRFRLYTQASGGTHFWEETQTVRTDEGLFSALLGANTPIGSMPDAGMVYLGMRVGSDAEMMPRVRIVSAAYAFKADTANYATSASPAGSATGDLGGTYPGPVVDGLQNRPVSSAAPGNGQALVWDGSEWMPAAITPSGSAGGDLAGNYPNPTVDGLQGRAVAVTAPGTNQVLKWTGSQWAPRDDSVGGGGSGGVASVAQTTGITCTPNPITATGTVGLNTSYTDGRYVNTTGDSMSGTLAVGAPLRVHDKAALGYSCYNNGNAAFCAGYGNNASGDRSSVTGGEDNSAGGQLSHISGGSENAASAIWSTVGGGNVNEATDSAATVAGGRDNTAEAKGTTVGGGRGNAASGWYAVVAGGVFNSASGGGSVVAGGEADTASSAFATVGGGYANMASSANATVSGGGGNTASGYCATIAGGVSNRARSRNSAVLGGEDNAAGSVASDTGAVVCGGMSNEANAKYAAVSGGSENVAGGDYSTVGGGRLNEARGPRAAVGGGEANTASGNYAAVAGGVGNNASDHYSTVGGGVYNVAGGRYATVAGGLSDTSAADYSLTAGYRSTVPASYSNSAAFNGQTATASNQTRVGALSKASGSFTIDHPLDPAGKILNHYFIEGPEMRNIYDGEAVLDATGRAVVALPDYFAALNRKSRVQLTGVGTSDVFVAREVSGTRFTIGGKPGTKVFWQVTGERKDVSAEATRRMMPVEQPKTGDLAGRMLDDEFISGCMEQLEREGKAQGIGFRTAAGRQGYEKMKRLTEESGR